MNNTALYILLLIPIFSFLFIISSLIKNKGKIYTSKKYSYESRKYLLTKSENDFFKILRSILGDQYYIFPQIHLPSLLNHKVVGQNWEGALSHIDRKSVDYVICDKTYLSPLLVLEFDDPSHDRPEREERDREVERVLEEADIPILRIPYSEKENRGMITQELSKSLHPSNHVA